MIWVTSFLKQGPYRNTSNLQSWTWPIIGIMVDYCFCSCPWIWAGSPTALTKRMWERWCSPTSDQALRSFPALFPTISLLFTSWPQQAFASSIPTAASLHATFLPILDFPGHLMVLFSACWPPHTFSGSAVHRCCPLWCQSAGLFLRSCIDLSIFLLSHLSHSVCDAETSLIAHQNLESTNWGLSSFCSSHRSAYNAWHGLGTQDEEDVLALPVAKCGLGVRLPSVCPAPAAYQLFATEQDLSLSVPWFHHL